MLLTASKRAYGYAAVRMQLGRTEETQESGGRVLSMSECEAICGLPRWEWRAETLSKALDRHAKAAW